MEIVANHMDKSKKENSRVSYSLKTSTLASPQKCTCPSRSHTIPGQSCSSSRPVPPGKEKQKNRYELGHLSSYLPKVTFKCIFTRLKESASYYEYIYIYIYMLTSIMIIPYYNDTSSTSSSSSSFSARSSPAFLLTAEALMAAETRRKRTWKT